jgi:hypothetical protein
MYSMYLREDYQVLLGTRRLFGQATIIRKVLDAFKTMGAMSDPSCTGSSTTTPLPPAQ